MNELRHQVRRARRRLIAEQWLAAFSSTLLVALIVAAVAVALPKLIVVGVEAHIWITSWLGGALLFALLGASAWTFVKRRNELDAAIAIDQRFGLKERVASSLSLDEDALETDAGRALLKDALRRVETIDVGERFRVRVGRRAWLSALPALIVFVLVLFVSDRANVSSAEAMTANIETQHIKKSAEPLKKKLAELRKKANEEDLKDAGDLFEKLEDGVRRLEDRKSVDRKEGMRRLNDLARELGKRRKNLGNSDDLRKQLNSLKDINPGPAEKVAKALKNGDLKKAINELKNLEQQIKEGKLDEESRKKLAEQLDQMRNKMQQMADAHQQAISDLQDQIERAKSNGDMQRANKLQEQLDNLAAKLPQMDRMRQMAEKMGQCSKCMQQGDADGAAQQLSEMGSDLQTMQSELDELQMLDDLQEQLAQAKESMGCENCNGAGCEECQGKIPGFGLGKGQGKGDRPEEQDKVGFRDSQVRQQPKNGRAVITDMVSGPNRKGKVRDSLQMELQEFKQQDDDPLTQQRLPKPQQEHAREYFDRFRDGT